jgi:hypothetical protein
MMILLLRSTLGYRHPSKHPWLVLILAHLLESFPFACLFSHTRHGRLVSWPNSKPPDTPAYYLNEQSHTAVSGGVLLAEKALGFYETAQLGSSVTPEA